MRKSYPVLLAVSLLAFPVKQAVARDPITITENGVTTPLSRNGLIDFLDDLKANPRDVTLTLLGHDFAFNVVNTNGQATQLDFISAEMGIHKTFTGADTGATINATEAFLKSDDFLGPFYRLINAGGDGFGTYSGNPNGTIDATATTAFNQVFMQALETAEERDQVNGVRDISIGAGFSKFDSDGFQGSSVKVSPSYGWKLGEKKDHALNLTMPVERITVEGLRSYRVGTILQFSKPFYLPWELVWRAAPDINYSFLGSEDIPSFSGTIGGGFTNTIGRSWGPYFSNLGLYYGRFQSLGGIKTDLKANLYSYGLQAGRRFGQRWVTSAYGTGVSEDLNQGHSKGYETVGVAAAYRIFNRFNVEFSVNRIFGIPHYDNTTATFGSAWNF